MKLLFSQNPRSRIPREFFWTLSALDKHYKTLLKKSENEPVRISHLLVMMAIYMLSEEKEWFTAKEIFAETTLPRSTVFRLVNDLTLKGVLEKTGKSYRSNAKSPNFLINPEELYGKNLAKVEDRDYHVEELIKDVLQSEFRKQIPTIVREEIAKERKLKEEGEKLELLTLAKAHVIKEMGEEPRPTYTQFVPPDEEEETMNEEELESELELGEKKPLSKELEKGGFFL